jgi:hypothetical protein
MRVYADGLHRLDEQGAFDIAERGEDVDYGKEVVIAAFRHFDSAANYLLPRLGKFVSH